MCKNKTLCIIIISICSFLPVDKLQAKGYVDSAGVCHVYDWTPAPTYYAGVASSVSKMTYSVGEYGQLVSTLISTGSYADSWWGASWHDWYFSAGSWHQGTIKTASRTWAPSYVQLKAYMDSRGYTTAYPTSYWPAGPPPGFCGVPCPENTKFDETSQSCKATCDPQIKLAKEEDCGGAQFLKSWDNETCSGLCHCEELPDDLNTIQFSSLSAFCGGATKVDNWTSDQCLGECVGCDQEYHNKEVECSAQGKLVDLNSSNAVNCEYNCVEEPCLAEFDAKEAECGFWGINPATKNLETCTAECAQGCDDEYAALQKKCGIASVASFNNSTCTGTCKDCEWSRKDCDNSCVSGYGKTDCTERLNNGVYVSIGYGACECLAPAEVLNGNTPPGETTYDGKTFANGIPGSHGGTVVKNPDGSYTETLSSGATFSYSADGQKVTATTADGHILTVGSDGAGGTTYTGTQADGAFTRITLTPKADGSIVKKTETGYDVNIKNPELQPNQVVSNTTTTTSKPGIATTIDGVVIPNPTYEPNTPDEVATFPVTGKYTSSASYDWHSRVNFTSWNAAKTAWNDKSPAAIYDKTIKPLIEKYVKPPEIPKWTIHFPSIGVLDSFEIKLDLTPFNGVVPWFRFFIALSMIFMTLRNIPKLWSGE